MKRKMNVWKTGIVLTMMAALLFAMVPLTAKAEDPGRYYLHTDGTISDTQSNQFDDFALLVTSEISKVTYVAEDNKLILNGGTFTHISIYENLTLHLVGTNTISGGSEYENGIAADAALTITAEAGGSLACDKVYGIDNISLGTGVTKTDGTVIDEFSIGNVTFSGPAATETTPSTPTEETTPAPETKPTILNGAKQTVSAEDGLTVRASGEITDFKDLYIDDKLVDKKNYDVKEGSTIVILKKEFLKTLSGGDHVLRFSFTTGDVETSFSLKAAPAQTTTTTAKAAPATTPTATTTSPKTGDASVTWFILLTLLFGSGILALAFANKKTN